MAAVPWWIVVTGIALSVVTATAAAWWPARAATRVSVTDALAGRPQRPVAVRRSVPVAAALLPAGFVALAAAVDAVKGDANAVLLIDARRDVLRPRGRRLSALQTV